METKIGSGKFIAENADISGSQFHNVNMAAADFSDVNLAGANFDDVNLSKTRFHNINFSDIVVSAVQIGGATFTCIGTPPDADGKQERQRPVRFENAMLCDSTFDHVDMSGVRLTECNTDGMTIDGVLVADLQAAYKSAKG